MRPRHRLGDAKARRTAAIRRVVDIAALALNQRIDQLPDPVSVIHLFQHVTLPSRS